MLEVERPTEESDDANKSREEQQNSGLVELRFHETARKRLTTPSSATAERGAVAAWWGEEKAYELRKRNARTRRAQARNSSYRDARSSSLQRMVRRYLNSLKTLRKSLKRRGGVAQDEITGDGAGSEAVR